MANAVSCCFTCNGMKSKLLMGSFFEQVKKIALHLGLTEEMQANSAIANDGKY